MDKLKGDMPLFSIVLAFRNEGAFLKKSLTSINEQSLSKSKWELILVDSLSDDNSREIAKEYVREHRNSKMVDNPGIIATSAWNIGINHSSGQYIIIANAHSIMDKDYMSVAERILNGNPKIQAICSKIDFVGSDNHSSTIAAVMNTSFALGPAYYRHGSKPSTISQISDGLYKSEIFERVGLFDNTLKRGGDWEFSCRLRAKGIDIFFHPDLQASVFSRSDLMSLFVQQFRTGLWKIRTWVKHPKSILFRHLIPAVFILWIFTVPFSFILFGRLLALFWLLPLIFYLSGIYIGIRQARLEGAKWYLSMIVFPIIHLSYGAGFMFGILRWAGLFLSRKGNLFQ